MQSNYFFQETTKVMNYFLIYKKISEYLFKYVMLVTLFFHLLTDSPSAVMLRVN